jgi:GNAT superfamily N-acetyltransferase
MMMSNVQIHSGYIPGAIGRVVELHATYYAQQWSFGLFFESKVATNLASFLNRFDEKHDGFWIAVHEQQIVGSISIDGSEAETRGGHLRWFILDSEYQGNGIGKQLLGEAICFCEQKHFQRVYLTTFAGLDPAPHLYEKWGFKLIEEEENNSWGVSMKEQMFERV